MSPRGVDADMLDGGPCPKGTAPIARMVAADGTVYTFHEWMTDLVWLRCRRAKLARAILSDPLGESLQCGGAGARVSAYVEISRRIRELEAARDA